MHYVHTMARVLCQLYNIYEDPNFNIVDQWSIY